jgi:tRNA-Thr(GGU) m(6)t(6)A37 methyltransferase TsaA
MSAKPPAKLLRLSPIGVIHTPFREAAGTPIQPRRAKGARGTVEVFEKYREGLKDLEGFERIWLVYWLDRAAEARLRVVPYLDDTERGLFATRAPCRPNPIGISPVRLLRVEGSLLTVSGVDILDGTPLLDIKPYVPEFDCYPASRSGWFAQAARRRRLADSRFERS